MNNFFQKRKFKIKKFKHQNLKEMLHLNINDESTKFGNKWVMVDGFKFQSIKEACYYQYLRGEKKNSQNKRFLYASTISYYCKKQITLHLYSRFCSLLL